MKKKNFNKTGIHIVFMCILLTLASGCSRQTKYKVLTFFFTGVPPLEEEKKPVKKIDISEVKKKIAVKVTLYSHTPWIEGKCNQCHKNAVSFGAPGQKKAPTVFRKGGGMPGKLILPKKELCIKCHDAMTKSRAYSKGLYLHPVTAEGECNACHDPHQSKNPDMLVEKPEKICFSCHLDEDVLDPVEACKTDDCLSCHNPHMGKDRLLLTKDYTEVPQKVTVQESASGSYEPTARRGIREQGSAVVDQGSDVGDQGSEVRDQMPEIGGQRSEVKKDKTEISSRGSAI